MTGAHRAEDQPAQEQAATADRDQTVWVKRGRPDPFRKPGVPDRLVLVLHREGMFYVGKLSTWEYHEIEIRRGDGTTEQHVDCVEMVVDVSRPRVHDLVVRMYERPTAARLVAELVDVLRGMVGKLAAPPRMTVPPAPKGNQYASWPNDRRPPAE
jgi:hypothetical protein